MYSRLKRSRHNFFAYALENRNEKEEHKLDNNGEKFSRKTLIQTLFVLTKKQTHCGEHASRQNSV